LFFETYTNVYTLPPPPAARNALLIPLLIAAVQAHGQFPVITATLSNYHGKNISCNGASDGSIDITVTGGTPPYTYLWNTGATTQDISGLIAGSYNVVVTDAAGKQKPGGWVLQEAGRLSAGTTAYEYPNGYNVSCNACYNGSINATVSGGVTPYTYAWNDGATTEDRSSIGTGNYQITVTDVNGCVLTSSSLYLSEPERTDWTMNGNAGTNPATQYIGTSDNKDVVFKTNGAEQLRLLSGGAVRSQALSFASGFRPVYADSLGTLRSFSFADMDAYLTFPDGCPSHEPWYMCGNTGHPDQFLGTTNNQPLVFVTFSDERMRITPEGKVYIGPYPNSVPSSTDYNLFVEGGIATRDVQVKADGATWPDFVFNADYHLMPLDQYRAYLHLYRHLPGIPSAAEVESKGGVELGDMQTRVLKVVEEQALYILQLEEKVRAFEQRLKALEASK